VSSSEFRLDQSCGRPGGPVGGFVLTCAFGFGVSGGTSGSRNFSRLGLFPGFQSHGAVRGPLTAPVAASTSYFHISWLVPAEFSSHFSTLAASAFAPLHVGNPDSLAVSRTRCVFAGPPCACNSFSEAPFALTSITLTSPVAGFRPTMSIPFPDLFSTLATSVKPASSGLPALSLLRHHQFSFLTVRSLPPSCWSARHLP
jgi:hypothetical protein